MHVYLCTMSKHVHLWSPEEGYRSLGTGVTDVVSYHVGAENQTWVLNS